MRITQEELHDLVVDTVRRIAGGGMERRRIIDRVEERLRKRGAWEPSDDAWSESTDPKTIGRAAIDWAISDLKKDGRLESLGRNRWVVAALQPPRRARANKLLMDVLRWAANHPHVLERAKAISDDAHLEFLVEEYYAWDLE